MLTKECENRVVFPDFLDHRQKICNNGVVGGFLAGKRGVCYASVESVDEFLNSFVQRPVVEEFGCVFDGFFFRREPLLVVEPFIDL